MGRKRLEQFAPHEREVLEDELAREELVQERLRHIIQSERMTKAIESLGGLDGMEKICEELKKHGLTVEKAMKMNSEEFANFMKENGIEVR